MLSAIGCVRKSVQEPTMVKDTTVNAMDMCREGVMDYDIKTVKEVGVDPKNKQKIIAEVHLKYPVLHCANANLEEAVNAYVETFIEDIIKSNIGEEDTSKAQSILLAAKAFVANSKTNIAELKKTEPDMDQVWYCDVIGNVEMQSGQYFTLRFKFNSYTGGAHPNYGEAYASFNMNTGKVLKWKDIISDSVAFIKLAEQRFKQVNGLDISKKLTEEEGFKFENNLFYLSENIGLTNEGLVVYYQPYEVAPFSFGPTKLLFKYFEINKLLNPNLFGETI